MASVGMSSLMTSLNGVAYSRHAPNFDTSLAKLCFDDVFTST